MSQVSVWTSHPMTLVLTSLLRHRGSRLVMRLLLLLRPCREASHLCHHSLPSVACLRRVPRGMSSPQSRMSLCQTTSFFRVRPSDSDPARHMSLVSESESEDEKEEQEEGEEEEDYQNAGTSSRLHSHSRVPTPGPTPRASPSSRNRRSRRRYIGTRNTALSSAATQLRDRPPVVP